MPKKKTGWRARPTVLVDGWRCPAGRARDMHPLCCPPATRRKAHGPGQVGAALSPPGPRWPEDQQEGLESVTSIFRYRLSVRNHPPPPSLGLLATRCIVVIPPRPSTVHGPRSARRCGCRQGTALQFSRPHPVNEIRLRRRTAEPSTSTSSPPRQSPTAPRTPARHHTQARLASPTTLTPLLFPLGAHPHHSSRFKH